MSSNPFFVVLLLGMGFRQFSMNSVSIPTIRRAIGQIALEDCRRIAAHAMQFITARETAEYLIDQVSRLVTMDLSRHVGEVRSPLATVS